MKSPTAPPFLLAYNQGDRATVTPALGAQLVAAGMARPVAQTQQQQARTAVDTRPARAEKRTT